MARRIATFFPTRLSSRVPNMTLVGGTEMGSPVVYANYGSPSAADAAIGSAGMVLNGQDISSAGSATTFLATFTQALSQMSPYGRCLWFAASGASTAAVTVTGRDYLGNRMTDQRSLNGTSTVIGSKAFRSVERIAWEAGGSVTMNVGVSNSFGLPFMFVALQLELKNSLVAANAGTIVAGAAAQAAATSLDPRGRYTPVTVLPDGTNTFELYYYANRNNLHGPAPFAA